MIVPKDVHRQRVLDHLVRLAGSPGWREFAWRAAKHYEEINPYDLAGIQQELKQRMTAEKAANETSSNRNRE